MAFQVDTFQNDTFQLLILPDDFPVADPAIVPGEADGLVGILSLGLAEASPVAEFRREILREFGELEIFAAHTTIALDAGQRSVDLPALSVRFLAAAYDNKQLDVAEPASLEWIDALWSGQSAAAPEAAVLKKREDKTFQLYPAPSAASASSLRVFYGVERSSVPAWMELLAALRILEREFGRKSDHRDPSFAQSAGELAKIVSALLFT